MFLCCFLFYREEVEVDLRAVYADVTPIPQDNGPNPVCVINYPPECERFSFFFCVPFFYLCSFCFFILAFLDTALMDLFRAFVKSGEISERFLELTSYILEINPSNFTIWF